MQPTRIFLVAGARPNFIKIAPIWEMMKKGPDEFDPVIVHTGQHFDYDMSEVFFRDLGLKKPDIYLGIGSGSHAEQTARILVEFEKLLEKDTPDMVLVVGDVNSTLACALATAKFRCTRQSANRPRILHVEAGLRSRDALMPEEINRRLTDQLSDILFTTSEDANLNLINEGIDPTRIFFVGNVMIDVLLKFREEARKSTVLETLGLHRGSSKTEYAVLTLHRPENVDSLDRLATIMRSIQHITQYLPVVFPVHPRTRIQLERLGLDKQEGQDRRLVLTAPLGYLEFLKLLMDSRFVLTDSGGVQEETTVLGIPCLTLRKNTERPVTVTEGTNVLCEIDPERIGAEVNKILARDFKTGGIPRLWDGDAASRIVNVINNNKILLLN